MAPNQQNLDILGLVERRLDSKLDSITKLLDQSLSGLKELYELRTKTLESKIIDLERKIDNHIKHCETDQMEDEQRSINMKNQLKTRIYTVIGWIVALLIATFSFGLNKIF
jgi:hypothetical protein